MIDRYYNLYITGEDELEILGPGFQMAETHALVESIQDYSVKDSTLYIRCMTDQGIETPIGWINANFSVKQRK